MFYSRPADDAFALCCLLQVPMHLPMNGVAAVVRPIAMPEPRWLQASLRPPPTPPPPPPLYRICRKKLGLLHACTTVA